MDAGAIRRGEAALYQAVQPALMRFPAAQRADVRCGRAQRLVERRVVELGIVGQGHQRGPPIGRDLGEGEIRPAGIDPEPDEALAFSKRGVRIDEQNLVARESADARQWLRDVYGADQDQLERRMEHLDEDRPRSRVEPLAAILGQQFSAPGDRAWIKLSIMGHRRRPEDDLLAGAKLRQQGDRNLRSLGLENRG